MCDGADRELFEDLLRRKMTILPALADSRGGCRSVSGSDFRADSQYTKGRPEVIPPAIFIVNILRDVKSRASQGFSAR